MLITFRCERMFSWCTVYVFLCVCFCAYVYVLFNICLYLLQIGANLTDFAFLYIDLFIITSLAATCKCNYTFIYCEPGCVYLHFHWNNIYFLNDNKADFSQIFLFCLNTTLLFSYPFSRYFLCNIFINTLLIASVVHIECFKLDLLRFLRKLSALELAPTLLEFTESSILILVQYQAHTLNALNFQ